MLKLRSNKGFTMVELLIVLAIIAILAAVAIPIYSSQLENSRVKVDESNLRAATGLAAQDYIVRFSDGKDTVSGGTGTNGQQKYLVLALKDNSNKNISSQNMVVLPAGRQFDEKGNDITNITVSKPQVAIDLKAYVNTDAPTLKTDRDKIVPGSRQYQGKEVIWFPIQQNSGKARFDIVIGSNGVVVKSGIVRG